MKPRQRAPDTANRQLVTCEACAGQAVNGDYHPASSAITNCCPGCNGLGRVDKKLGALPLEQVVFLWRARTALLQKVGADNAAALATLRAAFAVLHDPAHAPHPATRDYGAGKLND